MGTVLAAFVADLIAAVIRTMNAKVERIVIVDLRDEMGDLAAYTPEMIESRVDVHDGDRAGGEMVAEEPRLRREVRVHRSVEGQNGGARSAPPDRGLRDQGVQVSPHHAGVFPQ